MAGSGCFRAEFVEAVQVVVALVMGRVYAASTRTIDDNFGSEDVVARTANEFCLPLRDMCRAAEDAISSAHVEEGGDLDVVVSGGGTAAFYGGILCPVLASLQSRGIVRLRKLHGVSSGALTCALIIGCESGVTQPDDIYKCSRIFANSRYLSTGARVFLDSVLPDDIHERASNRMHVRLTELRSGRWPRKRIISQYPSRDFFLDVVMASCTLPGVTAARAYRPRDLYPKSARWLDGIDVGPLSLQRNGPHSRDVSPGTHLVIALNRVPRRMRKPRTQFLRSDDPDFDMMCVQALKDIVRLFTERRCADPAVVYFAHTV